ncbi:MAG: hypothetical protein R2851_24930 [Caldilineaceae bacterium]
MPLGFAVWLAHYLFHFLTGMMTLVPAFQTFAADTLGTDLLARPTGRWRRASCRPCRSSRPRRSPSC